MPSNARKRIFYLIFVMAVVGFVISGVAISMLYRAAFKEERARLIETAQSRARLIEAVARFDAIYSHDYPEGAEQATLSQIIDAHKNFRGFGETGEFTMARRDGERIVFILSHRHFDLEKLEPVSFDSKNAAPMRQALLGKSGSLIGPDYRGMKVLAAYEPVAILDLGIVAKIDIAEIRAPFITASFTAGGVAIVIIIIAAFIFLRISDPIVRRLKEYSQDLEKEVEERTSELMKSEKKYRSLFENMLDGFAYCKMIFDEDDKPIDFIYLEINDAFERLTGLTRDLVIDRKVTEAIPGIRESNPELFDAYGSAALTGKETQLETYVEPLDIWFSISIYSPEKGYFVAVFDNITKRKRAEEELKNEKDYLEKLHNSLGEAIFSVKMPERIIEFANQTVETIFGYRPEECIGQKTSMFYLEGEFEIFAEKMKKAIYSGEDLIRTEQNFVRKNGEEFPAEITTTFFREEGQVTRVISIVQDITERKRAEGEMRKLLTAIEHSANMIMITDVEGTIEYVNPKFTETTGFTKEEALGANPSIIASKETPKEVHKELWDTILGGQAWRGIYKNQKKNGEEYLASTVITPVKDEGGDITHFLAVQEDVTERQKMEMELANAQRLESLGVLAGGIAHDFNNILTGILANISLAYGFSNEDKVKSRLEEAEKATFTAKSLTQQLLTFSKGGEPVKKALDLGKLVKESTEFALSGSKTACEFVVSDEISVVEADGGQLDQVVQNLVINADQAMPEGGTIKVKIDKVRVEAKGKLPLTPGEYVRVSIIDHGIGIPKNIISKIFDPFYTTKAAGSGLGLASSYSIIRKHEGHINVTSKSGEGTTFNIYLPASELSVLEVDEPKGEIVHGIGRVLVMDDEEIVREVVEEMLGTLGYDVEVVNDGSEAIDSYKEAKERGNPFDLVIMDLTIPGGMGGEEAIKELKKIDPDVTAVVSSGYSNDPIMSDLDAHGFKGVIVKPYNIQQLSRVLSDLIKGA